MPGLIAIVIMPGLIATKIGMSRVFLDDGTEVPVTYLKVDTNTVVRHRTRERDGYDAVVLGAGAGKWRTRKGKEHTRFKTLKEFPVGSPGGIEIGSQVTVESIPRDSVVTVVGVSKGKGFAGVIKRWHFSSGPATHGSHQHREPGSIGCRAKPGRVIKGKRMAGRMGGERTTLKHRPVIVSDPEAGVIGVKGPVPGANGTTVFLNVESVPS